MPSMTTKHSVMQYAEVGAQVRLSELDKERRVILEMFPHLNGHGPVAAKVHAPTVSHTTKREPIIRRRRKPMTQTQREAIRRRMKAYWKTKHQAAKKYPDATK